MKVLDFGLAKALDPASRASMGAIDSPAPRAHLTEEGVILGTAPYMSPEQARGVAVDKRTDIWAFGCLLYEMLTGRAAFPGETVSDMIAGILEREPDWNALRADTPPSVRRLLRRCLEKDRRWRLADAADARLEIDDALNGAQGDVPPALVSSGRRASLVRASALVLAGLTVGAIVTWATRPAPIARGTTRTLVSVAPTDQPVGMNPLEQRVGARPTRTSFPSRRTGRHWSLGGSGVACNSFTRAR